MEEEIKRARKEMGEEWADKITDFLGANQDLHLDKLFDKEEVKTVRVKRREPEPQVATVEETVRVEQDEKEGTAAGQGDEEVQELSEEGERQAVKAVRKELAPEFITQRSISGPRPIPVPCSYRICVANHNTRHTADRCFSNPESPWYRPRKNGPTPRPNLKLGEGGKMVPAASIQNAGKFGKFETMKRVAKKDNPAEYEALAREARERGKFSDKTQFRDEYGTLLSQEEYVALPKFRRDKVRVFISEDRLNKPQNSKAGAGFLSGCYGCGGRHEIKNCPDIACSECGQMGHMRRICQFNVRFYGKDKEEAAQLRQEGGQDRTV